jgi:hypothetical protein
LIKYCHLTFIQYITNIISLLSNQITLGVNGNKMVTLQSLSENDSFTNIVIIIFPFKKSSLRDLSFTYVMPNLSLESNQSSCGYPLYTVSVPLSTIWFQNLRYIKLLLVKSYGLDHYLCGSRPYMIYTLDNLMFKFYYIVQPFYFTITHICKYNRHTCKYNRHIPSIKSHINFSNI